MTVNLEKSSPRWRGVNHLALVTSDMDATVRFYAGVLGARLVATVGTPAFRHYFFDFGTNSTIAFFEYRDVEPDSFSKPAGIPVPEAAQFDHLSFDLVDEDALLDLRERLKNANCEVTDVVDHGFIRSIYFTDPNGIALEASYWVTRPDRPRRRVVRRPPAVRRSEPGTRGRASWRTAASSTCRRRSSSTASRSRPRTGSSARTERATPGHYPDTVTDARTDATLAPASAPDGSEPTPAPRPRSGVPFLPGVFIAAALLFLGVATGTWWANRETTPSSVDIGFYDDMTSHHLQAIDMARIYERNGDTADLISRAQEIEFEQIGDIRVMQDALVDWGENGTPDIAMQWMGEPVAQDAMPGLATPDRDRRARSRDWPRAGRPLHATDDRSPRRRTAHGGIRRRQRPVGKYAAARVADGRDPGDGDRRAEPRAPGSRPPDPPPEHELNPTT